MLILPSNDILVERSKQDSPEMCAISRLGKVRMHARKVSARLSGSSKNNIPGVLI